MKKISVILIMSFSLSMGMVSMWRPLAFAGNRALLVGIGHYRISEANLQGIDKDINAMKVIAQKMGFTDEQIKVLKDSEATLKSLKYELGSWLTRGVTAEDRILFYYSGHGYYVKDVSGDEEDGFDEVLVPYDATEKGGNLLLDDDIKKLIDNIPSSNVFFFLDSCHSGTAIKSGAFSSVQAKFYRFPWLTDAEYQRASLSKRYGAVEKNSENCVLLAAAQDNQTAQASREGSYFTRGVTKAFCTAKTSLTLDEIEKSTKAYINDNLKPALRHTPNLIGNPELMTKNLIAVNDDDNENPIPDTTYAAMEYFVQKRHGELQVTGVKTGQRVGDTQAFSVKIPKNGYLNIFEVYKDDPDAMTVLYPNKFHPTNFVTGGQTIEMPSSGDDFDLRALDPGKSKLVFLLTDEAINGYELGKGGSDEWFKQLSTKTFRKKYRKYGATKREKGSLFAASFDVEVVR